MLGNQSNKIYLSVSDGKVIRRVAEGTPGAEARTKKDGSITWEQRFSFITGQIKSISTKTNNFQGTEMKDWVFEIEDGSESYTLQIMYDSRYAVSLLNALCNPAVDLTKPVTISPWMKIVNDKKKTACYLKQGTGQDNGIDWFFTKDHPNGLPELKQVVFKGKESWDNFDQVQFLENYIETKVKPRLAVVGNVSTYNTPTDNSSLPDDDDLPF